MTMNLLLARQDTPGCENTLHLNNAGAALMPKQVVEATVNHLRLEALIGGYEAAEKAYCAIERVYTATASLVGCYPDEIAFTENASRAWNMAFHSIPWKAGDCVLVSIFEYASNYMALLQIAQKKGVAIKIIPNDEYGQISLEDLQKALDDKVKLVAIPHVPHNSGLINPIVEAGKIVRASDALYLVDASQSVGQIPIDVKLIGCDILVASGRKYLRGPRGTGFLYIRRELINHLEPPILDVQSALWVASDRYELRSGARRLETWEVNYAGKIGLGVAIDYALQWGIDVSWDRISTLAKELRSRLSDLPNITLLDLGKSQCGIVTFNLKEIDPEIVRSRLIEKNINISVSTLTLSRLDMEARGLSSLARASVHYYNSEREIDKFCKVLASIT